MRVNIAKTKEYYQSIRQEDLCSCAYCKNYYLQVKAAYPDVSNYLCSLGADIEKPLETSPLEPDESGTLEYCACQYVVLGICPDGFRHNIGDVEVRISASHPRIHVRDAHFVLEFFPVRLPWTQSP